MGVHTLVDKSYTRNRAVMFCSTTDWAFGPVFTDSDGHDAFDRVESFLRWLKTDPRKFSDAELESRYYDWRRQEDEQWARESKEKDDEYKPWGSNYDNPSGDKDA